MYEGPDVMIVCDWRKFMLTQESVCRHAPFLIAFEERAQVFQTVIAADRGRRREMGAYGPQSFVTIHRDTLMQVSTFQMCSLGFDSPSICGVNLCCHPS